MARPQGCRPAAVFYPFGHPTPNAYGTYLDSEIFGDEPPQNDVGPEEQRVNKSEEAQEEGGAGSGVSRENLPGEETLETLTGRK
jgi:hypothetical protein